MDSGGAPEGIGRSHSCHQGADFGGDARPAHRGPAGEPSPVLAEPAPLPPQNRVGSNHHEGYAVCDAAMRRHVDSSRKEPTGFPYPNRGV